MDKRYLQKGFNKQLSHVIEECGEVLSAAGKLQRWGKDSVNPLLSPEDQESNIDWLMREINDLEQTIARFKNTVLEAGYVDLVESSEADDYYSILNRISDHLVKLDAVLKPDDNIFRVLYADIHGLFMQHGRERLIPTVPPPTPEPSGGEIIRKSEDPNEESDDE